MLEVLYTLIHGCERENQAELNVDITGMEKIHAFTQLKQYANPSQQERFVMRFDMNQTQVLFEIDGGLLINVICIVSSTFQKTVFLK